MHTNPPDTNMRIKVKLKTKPYSWFIWCVIYINFSQGYQRFQCNFYICMRLMPYILEQKWTRAQGYDSSFHKTCCFTIENHKVVIKGGMIMYTQFLSGWYTFVAGERRGQIWHTSTTSFISFKSHLCTCIFKWKSLMFSSFIVFDV